MERSTLHAVFNGTRTLAVGCALSLAVGGVATAQGQADPAGQGPPAAGQESQGTQGTQGAQGATPGQGGRRGGYAGVGRVGGEVTAVAGNTLTIKTEDGHAAQVITTDNTRVMKDRGPVKVADLHVGDGLMAFGNLDPDTHTLHAAVVMATDAAELKAMRENLGKTYITGRVTAINLDDARMTVERPDHVAQTIGFDETTSFKRAVRGERGNGNGGEARGGGNGGGMGPGGGGNGGGMGPGGGMGAMGGGGAMMDRAFANGESITLADIKVGDNVMGTGTVKGGVFVPARLLESQPRPRGPRAGAGSAGADGAGAGTAQPAAAGAATGPGAR